MEGLKRAAESTAYSMAFTTAIFGRLTDQPKALRDEVNETIRRKKKSYLRRELAEVQSILKVTGRSARFPMLCALSLLFFAVGASVAVMLSNFFLVPVMLVIALAVKVFPVYIQKQQLDTFATELIREAEIAGQVGSETSRREQLLREKTGLSPSVEWSETGRIQLNEEVTVTVTYQTNIGLFGGFGSFPITLRADAAGKSEVYWK